MKSRAILILLLFTINFLFAQKKKSAMDISSNLQVNALGMKGVGNNALAKDFNGFYGVGLTGQLMTPIHFGLELSYNLLFSSVKYGHENMIGNLGSQKLSEIGLNVVHKDELGVDFAIEESVGFSILRLNSLSYPGNTSYTEGKGGFNAQLKGIYTLDNEGTQQFVFGLKMNTYSSGAINQNAEIQKYYRKSILIGIFAGYRYNF